MKSRLDYFLLWNHGIAHQRALLDLLRQDDALHILKILQHRTDDMSEFVTALYSCDHVPFEHLQSKTRYLLDLLPEVLVVLVRNDRPQERLFGNGAFRHIQCARIKAIKEIIRDRFNPRVDGCRTEEHVIHASDYESQTEHLLKMLGLKGGLEQFRHRPNPLLDLPYHLPRFERFRLRQVAREHLLCNILTGTPKHYSTVPVSIENTPHYRFAIGDRQTYEEYISRFAGYLLTDDHGPDRFAQLAEEFVYLKPPHQTSYILVEGCGKGNCVIRDGVHRASILAAQGVLRFTVAEMHMGVAA